MANILLVDDESLVLDTLSTALKSSGHTVVTACNGAVGLMRFAEQKFDLVVTDVIMPDMDGVELIQAIRRRDPEAKILAISGGGRTGYGGYLTIAERFGATAVLQKPIRLAEFLVVLSSCLAG